MAIAKSARFPRFFGAFSPVPRLAGAMSDRDPTAPSLLTRRDAAKRTLLFSAAFLTPGWLARLPAAEPGPLPAEGLHFLVVADYGSQTEDQKAIARRMAIFADHLGAPLAAVLALGDNFYGHLTPERFGPGFEEMYSATSLPCAFYACAGNHDYGTKYDAQPGKLQIELDYATQHPASRWKYPSKWYTLHFPSAANPLVKIIVLDSNYGEQALTPEEEVAQDAFLAAELAQPTAAPWTWVAAHHPLYSDGPHGDNATLIARWGPLLRQADIPLYITGHDHTLQHLQIEGQPTSFVVTGGGGMHLHDIKPQQRGEQFIKSGFGFTHIHLTQDALRLQFVDEEGRRLYGFTKTRDGKITPLA